MCWFSTCTHARGMFFVGPSASFSLTINEMLAKRARGRVREHGLAEETGNGGAEVSGRKDTVGSIHVRWTSGEPRVGVWRVQAVQALKIATTR
jgi:hypothetical protein